MLVRFAAAGLCHSDDHLRTGDIPVRYPIVGGHEGAGVVEEVGAGVTRLKPGDHVVCSFLPTCGHCRFCAQRHDQPVRPRRAVRGQLPAGRHVPVPRRRRGLRPDVPARHVLRARRWCPSTRASRSTTTCRWRRWRWSAAGCRPAGAPRSTRGGVRPGDTTVIYGIGGVGINAVQGAAFAGARNVIAVDPLAVQARAGHGVRRHAQSRPPRRSRAGARHRAHPRASARTQASDHRRRGDRGGHRVGVRRGPQARHGRDHRAGRPGQEDHPADRRSSSRCSRSGSRARCSAAATRSTTIPRLLDLYRAGQLKLDELITTRYRLDDVNQGYRDMLDGRNIRGLMIHDS